MAGRYPCSTDHCAAGSGRCTSLRRGESVRLDVVVRTKSVGHFFPGGTVDAYDTWVELKGVDDKGQTVFWSGKVDDEGKGPWKRARTSIAHSRSTSTVIRSTSATPGRLARSSMFASFHPGAADTVHFRVKVPGERRRQDQVHRQALLPKVLLVEHTVLLRGRLEGRSVPMTAGYDDRAVTFDGVNWTVSGKIKSIPDLPILTIAENTTEIRVLPKNRSLKKPRPSSRKKTGSAGTITASGFFCRAI